MHKISAVLSFFLFISVSLASSVGEDDVMCVSRAVCASYDQMNTQWSYPKGEASLSSQSPFWSVESTYATIYQNGQKVKGRISVLCLKDAQNYEALHQGVSLLVLNICQALDSLLAEPAALECTLAIKVAQTACVRTLMGSDDLFNIYATSLYRTLHDKKQFLMCLPQQFLKEVEGEAPVGSFLNITNVPDYHKHKPHGYTGGHNVYRVAEDAYMGFEPDFFTAPKTLLDIENLLFEELLKEDDVEVDEGGFAKKVAFYKKNRKLFDSLRRSHQVKQNIYTVIDKKAVAHFKETGEITTYDL